MGKRAELDNAFGLPSLLLDALAQAVIGVSADGRSRPGTPPPKAGSDGAAPT